MALQRNRISSPERNIVDAQGGPRPSEYERRMMYAYDPAYNYQPSDMGGYESPSARYAREEREAQGQIVTSSRRRRTPQDIIDQARVRAAGSWSEYYACVERGERCLPPEGEPARPASDSARRQSMHDDGPRRTQSHRKKRIDAAGGYDAQGDYEGDVSYDALGLPLGGYDPRLSPGDEGYRDDGGETRWWEDPRGESWRPPPAYVAAANSPRGVNSPRNRSNAYKYKTLGGYDAQGDYEGDVSYDADGLPLGGYGAPIYPTAITLYDAYGYPAAGGYDEYTGLRAPIGWLCTAARAASQLLLPARPPPRTPGCRRPCQRGRAPSACGWL